MGRPATATTAPAAAPPAPRIKTGRSGGRGTEAHTARIPSTSVLCPHTSPSRRTRVLTAPERSVVPVAPVEDGVNEVTARRINEAAGFERRRLDRRRAGVVDRVPKYDESHGSTPSAFACAIFS